MRVLIVDDHLEMRQVLATALTQFGWDIEQAENGAQALAIHTLKHKELDAILLDQVMPGMDGINVLPKLLKINPDVPVIMLTAHSSIPLVTQFLQLGGSGFIEKSATHFEILLLRIEDAIRQARRRKELDDVRANQQATAILNRNKDLFLANMSHELTTPLLAILHFAALAKRRLQEEKNDEAMVFLDRLIAGKERLLRFASNLECLARLHTEQTQSDFKLGDLIPLVHNVVREEEQRSGLKSLSWPVTGDDQVWACFDAAQIRTALIELLDNARHYSPPGAIVAIAVTHDEQQTRIAIRDAGPGIPPGEEEAIFTPFTESSRTRCPSGGTGLGLAVAIGLVQLHGGSIQVTNRADGPGAEFTLVLPNTRSPSP